MSQFWGNHQNRLDAKGRVSIPAPYRTALRGEQAASPIAMVLRPSHLHACIEGWSVAAFQALAAPLDAMDVFSPEHDDLAATLYCDAYAMEADREGRIVLPNLLVAHAGLSETVAFMGMGRTFQIWEPEAARRRATEARGRARENGLTLPVAPARNLNSTPQQLLGTPRP